tara:strand:- start:4503 stop:5177 length:675 start_codon:yes stop_codon:yes gene_type:complete
MSDTNIVSKLVKEKNMEFKSPTNMYQLALPLMGHDLAMKYADYYQRKTRLSTKGRVAFKDSTRSKFYDAERRFENKYGNGINFNNIEDAQKYAKRVCKSKLWKELTETKGSKDVIVFAKKLVRNSATAGSSWGYKIQLDQMCGMNEFTLLHEMAHSAGYMHHDISYRKAFLRLVSRFMGMDAAKKFKAEIKRAGLKMIIKNTIKTPEQWLKDYIKMTNLRKKIK